MNCVSEVSVYKHLIVKTLDTSNCKDTKLLLYGAAVSMLVERQTV